MNNAIYVIRARDPENDEVEVSYYSPAVGIVRPEYPWIDTTDLASISDRSMARAIFHHLARQVAKPYQEMNEVFGGLVQSCRVELVDVTNGQILAFFEIAPAHNGHWRATEHVREDLTVPGDYLMPDWYQDEAPYEWHRYVVDALKDIWRTLDPVVRMALAQQALLRVNQK